MAIWVYSGCGSCRGAAERNLDTEAGNVFRRSDTKAENIYRKSVSETEARSAFPKLLGHPRHRHTVLIDGPSVK